MANFGSLIMGFAAVGAIGIASYALGQNKSRKINSFDDVYDVIHSASPDFDLSEILISENGNCALIKGKNGELFFAKSMGDEIAIRGITNAQISQNENQTKISFNDITFPDFSGVLTVRGK
ncbi:MAG: hypothetical protein J0L55_12690 [Caulobacterales bacterium]|nr:hypothetical protein [Caulobacterales bacterium]MCA0373427.1 hypothetical protein [Pseudomonadota bacterium]